MFDNGISTDNAVGISGGAMAALAMLRGSDIYVGLRQGIVDLVNEGKMWLEGERPSVVESLKLGWL